METVFWEVALKQVPSGTKSSREIIEEIRNDSLKDTEGQVVLFCALSCPRQKSVSHLCSFSHHPHLSHFHLICNHLSSCHHHLRLNAATASLLSFCFGLLLYLCPGPTGPPSFHFAIRSIQPKSAFKTEPTSTSIYVSLFLDSPFSYHISKALLPSGYSDTYLYQ